MVDFLIVGTPKAGTTSLQHYLSQHPEIYMPREKEIHFFGAEFKSQLSEKEYVKVFQKADLKQTKGEASVFYLYSESSLEEIYKYNPSMKIIICLRNPVDFLISYHQDSIYVGNEDEPDFFKALELESKRKKGHSIPKTNSYTKSIFYSELVDYATYVEKYRKRFGSNNVQILIFEDLFEKPVDTYRTVLNFLGIKKVEFKPNVFDNKNPRRTLKSKSLNSILKNPNGLLRTFIKCLFPFQSWRYFLSNKLVRFNTSYSKRNDISFEEKKKLFSKLLPNVERLEIGLDVKLTRWKNKYQ